MRRRCSDAPADPSSRALFYSSTKVPLAYADGYTDPTGRDFDVWADTDIQLRSLDPPKLVINMFNVHNTDSGSMKIDRIDISANASVTDAVLFVAIAENDIDASNPKLDPKFLLSGETKFNYVLKKMLPSASGTPLKNMVSGASISLKNFAWAPDLNHIYSNNYTIIVFVQNIKTKEVYQTQMSAPLSVSNNNKVTAVADESNVLTLFPNPSNREVHIVRKWTSDNDMLVRIVDQMGVMVIEQQMKKEELEIRISTELLASGVYIVQTGEGSGAKYTKLVVVH